MVRWSLVLCVKQFSSICGINKCFCSSLFVMRKLVFLMIVITTTTVPAIEVPCRYGFRNEWYLCDLNNGLNISNSSIQITAITGKHADQKSNSDVQGFRVDNKTLHYLPRGLEKYFVAENVQFIELQSTGLQAIHQIDLKPFTKLTFFSAWRNNLRVLERDLFKYNTEITYIGLGQNKIQFIDGNVFKNLNQLETLYLDGNNCTRVFVNGKESVDYKNKLFQLTKVLWEQCSPHS